MKKLLLLILCLGVFTAYAKNLGIIDGTLLDEQNQPVSFATVLLLNASDSTLIKAELANEHGQFLFENLQPNSYLISASIVGFEKYLSDTIKISTSNLTIHLGVFTLHPAHILLQQVQVQGTKPFLIQKADKLVMNVEGSVISAGSTALELLQRAPGVSVNQNDIISLKGKQGVIIYIDGKPSYLSQDQLSLLLKNTSSDQISKIEIITHPSAKYDAAGNAGIINIITKKSENFGTNGSITLGGGVAFVPLDLSPYIDKNAPRQNYNLQLNNRKGKFNTFGNLSFLNNKNFTLQRIDREIGNRNISQVSSRETASKVLNSAFGIDYFLSDKTTLGLLINANTGKWIYTKPSENISDISNSEGKESSLKTLSNPSVKWSNLSFNTNFKHSFGKQEISADLDYAVYNNLTKENGMLTSFLDASGNQVGDVLKVTSNIPNIYNIWAAKMDYSVPLDGDKNLEFGVKASFVNSDNDIRFFNDNKIDMGRSNHYLYYENIQAAYSNFSTKFGKNWDFQAGLRLENTFSKGDSKTFNEINQRTYFQLFPSLFVTREINNKNKLNFNYSRRIDRPDYESLNPFIFFLDPYTYQLGNENLEPQITDGISLSHTYNSSIITSLGYSYTSNYSDQVIKNAKNEPEILAKLIKYNPSEQIDPTNVSFAITENIGTRENLNLTTSFPIQVNKWWNMNNNLTFYYNKYKGNVSDENLNFGNFAYNVFSTQMFNFKKGWKAELSGYYRSKETVTIFLAYPSWAMNGGVSKSFKNGNLKFNITDIFSSVGFKGETKMTSVKMKLNNKWSGTAISATFIYKFGNQKVKNARNRQTATSDEKIRVKNN